MISKNHRMLENALIILDYISQNTEGKSLAEITIAVDMPKSSVHSILTTFSNLNYINKNPKTNHYTLGIKSFEVGSRYTENLEFLKTAQSVLKKVSRDCDETAHLGTLDGTDVVYLFKFESTQAIRMVSNIGKRNPAHATALGKALLSKFSDDEIRELYKDKQLISLTENTITNLDKLIEQIREIRITGLAFEKEESTPNIQCMAVLINKNSSQLLTAMSISIPTFRINVNTEIYTKALMEGKNYLDM